MKITLLVYHNIISILLMFTIDHALLEDALVPKTQEMEGIEFRVYESTLLNSRNTIAIIYYLSKLE